MRLGRPRVRLGKNQTSLIPLVWGRRSLGMRLEADRLIVIGFAAVVGFTNMVGSHANFF